jgi:hypothetical protein
MAAVVLLPSLVLPADGALLMVLLLLLLGVCVC